MSAHEGREYELDARTAAKMLEDDDHVAFMMATMQADGYVQSAMHFDVDDGVGYPPPAVMMAGMVNQIADAEDVAYERVAEDFHQAVLDLGGDIR